MFKKSLCLFLLCLLSVHLNGNPKEKNIFHGWWRKISKGNAADYGVSPHYMYINADDVNTITAQGFGGTLNYAVEYSNPSKSIDQFRAHLCHERVLCFIDDISATVTVDGITGTFPDNLNFYFTLQEGGRFDGLGFMSNSSPAENSFLQLSSQGDLYEKLTFEPIVKDPTRPTSTGDAIFNNNKRRMFEQIDYIFFEENTPALSPPGHADLLMARPQGVALRDKILNEGVEREPLTLYGIHKTTKCSGTTTLFTREAYPFVSFASTITLSGLSGEWAALNNTRFQVVGIYNTDNETVQEQAPFFLSETRTYHILIKIDTSSLPHFDPLIHAPTGALIKPSKIGPIAEDSEYREWVDAAIFYTQKVLQQSSHAGFGCYGENTGSGYQHSIDSRLTKSPLSTWADVTAALAGNIPAVRMEYRYKASGLRASLICPAYYLPYYIAFSNIQINEPFQQLGIPGSELVPEGFPPYAIGTPHQLPIAGFNVPFENYLLPESRRWLYFRIKPNSPVTNAQQENVWEDLSLRDE